MRRIDETPAPAPEREEHPDALTYWGKRDRWEALGRELGKVRLEAKRLGVTLESMPGAGSLIEAFKAAGRELDKRVR